MGYIAPIPQFQQVQYAERDIRHRSLEDPFPVSRTAKVDNTSKFQRMLDARVQLPPKVKETEKENERDDSSKRVYHLFPEVTGKGMNFNEYV